MSTNAQRDAALAFVQGSLGIANPAALAHQANLARALLVDELQYGSAGAVDRPADPFNGNVVGFEFLITPEWVIGD